MRRLAALMSCALLAGTACAGPGGTAGRPQPTTAIGAFQDVKGATALLAAFDTYAGEDEVKQWWGPGRRLDSCWDRPSRRPPRSEPGSWLDPLIHTFVVGVVFALHPEWIRCAHRRMLPKSDMAGVGEGRVQVR